MADSDDFQIPPEQEQLHVILMKIITYQHSLSDGREVELDELRREGVLSPADVEILTTHSVTYKIWECTKYPQSVTEIAQSTMIRIEFL